MNKCQGKQNCTNVEDLRVFSIKHDVGITHITFCEACWNEARVNIADPPVYHRKSRNYPVSGYYRRPAPKWDYLSPISCFK